MISDQTLEQVTKLYGAGVSLPETIQIIGAAASREEIEELFELYSPFSDEAEILPHIPALLKSLPNWVTWRLTENGKEPFVANSERHASSTDASTWVDFSAVKNCTLNHVEGIGFVIGGAAVEKQIVGFDLDGCRNPETGGLTSWATKLVELLDSYTEVTPSGLGVRVWVIGKLPTNEHVFNLTPNAGFGGKVKIEVFDRARYFTVTGNAFFKDSTSSEVKDIETRDLTTAFELCRGIKAEYPVAAKTTVDTSSAPGESVQIERTSTVITSKLELLMHGTITSRHPFIISDGFGNSAEYPSQSEADQALCNLLAIDGLDKEQIDEQFRKSSLHRSKWNRNGYRDGTIANAIRSAEKAKDKTVISEPSTGATLGDEPTREQEPSVANDLVMPESAMQSTRLGDIYAEKFASNDFPLGMALPALVTAASVRVPMLPPEPGLIRGDNQMVNLYTALIGPVACGKSQVAEWACSALNIYNPVGDSPRYLEVKTGSTEMLLRNLKKEISKLSDSFLINPDEWAFLFAKAGVPNSSFATFMTTSYYRRRQSFEVGNRVGHVDLNHAISFIGGIVEEEFDTVFGASSIGGLYDRFLFGYAPGWRWDYCAYPFQMSLDDFDWKPVPVQCDGSVYEVIKHWNRKDKGFGRVVEICKRVAMIYASMDGRPVLHGQDLEKLEGLARHQVAVRAMFHPNQGLNPDAVFTNAVINWLTAHTHGEWVNISTVKNGVHGYEMKLGPNVAERALAALSRGDRVEVWLTKRDGADPMPTDWTGARPRVGLVRLRNELSK